ncbi:MAG: uroporphyrinogen-III synthase [Ginsengibacter sp.]
MQKNNVHILSTRPVGKALMDEAVLHDIFIDEISFIDTEELINPDTEKKIQQLSDENINAVFTSMNAVEAVRRFISPNSVWKIFCIGNTTKQLAEDLFGKEKIAVTAYNASQLAENISENPQVKKVHFFCGDQRRDELPRILKENNIQIEEIVVYKTIETPQVISRKYDGILFFSPSAVQSFFLKNSISPDTKLFAIGSTTANALKLFTQQHVIIANVPGKKNLVFQAINFFSKTQIS